MKRFAIVVLVVFVGVLILGAQEAGRVDRYEYQMLPFSEFYRNDDMMKVISLMGQDGWRVAHMVMRNNYLLVFFERKITTVTKL